jgi:hypothetical protein
MYSRFSRGGDVSRRIEQQAKRIITYGYGRLAIAVVGVLVLAATLTSVAGR